MVDIISFLRGGREGDIESEEKELLGTSALNGEGLAGLGAFVGNLAVEVEDPDGIELAGSTLTESVFFFSR